MDFRLARQSDIPELTAVYLDIIEHMDSTEIAIWNEVYPCAFFPEDIDHGRLHVLIDRAIDGRETIAGAFALCGSNDGARHISWENKTAKALYIDRLGVNVRYIRRGIATRMIEHAIALAKGMQAQYIRLFVVDINEPAIRTYVKNGFKQADGVFDEPIDESLTYHEFGFERYVGTDERPKA